MLFGSFFTVYFFDRVVNHGAHGRRSPDGGSERPWFVALVNTLHPRHLELHDALGDDVGEARQPRRPAAGMMLTFLLGLTFLLTQVIEYHRIGFNTGDTAFAATFFGLTGLHGCHVFVGLRSCSR